MATKLTKKVPETDSPASPKGASGVLKKVPKSRSKAKAPKVEEAISRLRIRVRAYESKILDISVKQIIDTALRYDATIQGPIPLPTEIKKYTVNRSAFIYKNAREQFEMRVHKRLIDILNPTPKIIESLTNLSLPSGVNIDVKLI
ncbi:MAG: 30S ribosomal protein S10 [Candidatus Zambryskibacteria bacterium CG_4_9_14_3_um_filter_42_9]|uniref:Small ribosomal subunit protein uS10 n=1 Tax=Candidatus Zambryskibacteria bacterium CG22_combo_CG10-13_8_21_14_all_42_17 TaxID=1975118 RepID=A0A2H0BDM3_9BACT|nr:MAG: 30S ribosomal protein S10 [Candidatus Zambryskibacteria bacterium CG22_combo_CG10-13_8_21_14_all_42_17]PJA36757.1 MAG: 30S ribosomal protein S10 [Candidatus Zambryskibacteria bacterium CG_4_9_14_3_um_filter_42_9]